MDQRSEMTYAMRKYVVGDAPVPLLSIFIPARNDGFMENFNYRIETTANYIARNLEKIGRLHDVELIVIDWGSKIPLHQVLHLSREAEAILRYIIVPPHVAVPAQKDSVFPIVLAQNVAIRRARGAYIMQTDSDVMFPRDFFEGLFRLLDDGVTPFGASKEVFFSSQRKHIPWKLTFASSPIEVLEAFIVENSSSLACDDGGDYGYCATGMMMMHRDMWFEVSGYDERLIHWGWMEIDLGMRLTKRYPWCDVTRNFGMMLYHMEHYPQGKRVVNRKYNRMDHPEVLRPNADDWGLAGIDLPEFRYATAALMFLS